MRMPKTKSNRYAQLTAANKRRAAAPKSVFLVVVGEPVDHYIAGVYSTRANAEAAVLRVKERTGRTSDVEIESWQLDVDA